MTVERLQRDARLARKAGNMDEAEAALRAAIRLLKAEFNRLDPARHEPANATAPEEVRVIAELLADSIASLAGVRRA